MEQWLDHVRNTRRPTTTDSYEGIVRRYVMPAIGHVHLADLRREHVDHVLSSAQLRLCPSTLKQLRAVLGIALHRAERWEIPGARNVVRLTDPPRVEPRELSFLSVPDARRFLEIAQGDRFEIVYLLGITVRPSTRRDMRPQMERRGPRKARGACPQYPARRARQLSFG
jgi:hypothetical protein